MVFMAVRKRRKKNKLRGGRTQHGNTKNARGSGCRGGVGMAGGHKHRFSICYKNFGVKIRMKTKKNKLESVKLSEFVERIPILLKKKLAEKKGSEIIIDCEKAGIGKIFGQGEIKGALLLKNIKATENVRLAIEKAGGKIETEKFEEKKQVQKEESAKPKIEAKKEEKKGEETEK